MVCVTGFSIYYFEIISDSLINVKKKEKTKDITSVLLQEFEKH